MKYPLYDMNCDDFESLTVLLCNHILGSATIPFAKGKDGGRDGKFIGRANMIPSQTSPWDGKIIIQAKHTTTINASCSDSTFNRILNDEVIPAVKKLKTANDIDYYLLFTNRKLTGIKDSEIEKKIKEATSVPTILIAEEKIQMLLAEYPDVVKTAELNRLLLPFEFDESDLREVILYLNSKLKSGEYVPSTTSFEYPGLERKNELNNLSQKYFDGVIAESMDDFDRIRHFLTDSINKDIADVYDDAASELNAKIVLRRDQYYEFEQILEDCYTIIVSDNAPVLHGKKKLVRKLLHYMYCNCDIGIKE